MLLSRGMAQGMAPRNVRVDLQLWDRAMPCFLSFPAALLVSSALNPRRRYRALRGRSHQRHILSENP